MLDSKITVMVILWAIYWLILTPILIYYGIKFYQLRYTQIVRKRFYHLTLFLAMSSIFTVGIYSPFYLLRIYYVYGKNISFVAMEIFYPPMYSIAIYTIAALATLRFWCLWYYVKWTKATLDAEWKIHISKELSENWFIKHQHTYGAINYTSKLALIYLIIVATLFGICRYFHVFTTDNALAFIFATIFNLLSLILPVTFGTIIWCKMPSWNDSFDLVREHQIMARILAALVVLYIIVYAVGFAGASDYTRFMMGNVMSALYGFTTSAFPLCYAVRIANSQEYALMLHSPSISSMSRLKLVPSASKSSNLPNVSNSINNALGKFSFDGRRSSKSKNEKHDRSASVANESIQPQMIQILGHQLAFSAFMAHLSNEFSMELLLSFVELTQYKKAVLDKLGLSKNDTMNVSISTNCTPNTSDQDADIEIIDEDQNIFRFHSDKEKIPKQQQKILDNPSIPLSFIVHSDIEQVLKNHRENSRRQSFSYSKSNNDEPKHEVANDERDKLLNEFQVRGFVLYCKYVDSSSEYQINISDEESKTLINKLNYRNKLNEHDLFTLYDKTLQELWQLLRHSYYRFIKTSEYQELLQYIQ